jgi:hypothetical protein
MRQSECCDNYQEFEIRKSDSGLSSTRPKRRSEIWNCKRNVEKRGRDLVLCASLEVLCSQETRMRIGVSISRRDKGVFLWNLFLI